MTQSEGKKRLANVQLEVLRDMIYALQLQLRDNSISAVDAAEAIEPLKDKLQDAAISLAEATNLEEEEYQLALGRLMHEQEKGHDGL